MCWGPMRDNLWRPTANGKQVAATKHADISVPAHRTVDSDKWIEPKLAIDSEIFDC